MNLRKTYETVLINLDDSDSPMVTPVSIFNKIMLLLYDTHSLRPRFSYLLVEVPTLLTVHVVIYCICYRLKNVGVSQKCKYLYIYVSI